MIVSRLDSDIMSYKMYTSTVRINPPKVSALVLQWVMEG